MRKSSWQMNGKEQFIGGHHVALVAGVEFSVGDAAAAALRDHFDIGVVDQQSRRRVRGGRTIDKVAAEGGAALVGNGTDPACRPGNERELGGEAGMCAEIE